ncbi:MAG: histidine--tRNA ligase [Clostridia bacterium]
MKITKPKGTYDIYSTDAKKIAYVENIAKDIVNNNNFNEIRTPVFEHTEVFLRGVGEGTDIVTKEMYTFSDKAGRSLTLKPEYTASVVRSYIENGFSSMPSPIKLWYIGTLYRYEKMQKGRNREFNTFGIEIFGSESYLADVYAINIGNKFLDNLGLLDKITLKINTIGCSECRKKYITKMKEYLSSYIDTMCDDCKNRYVKNPLRIIDCKEDKCKKIIENMPMITDNVCDDCKKDFENVKLILNNLNIDYIVDKTIVRGLDYYNRTVFEYVSKDLNIALGGGGRYDKLVETLGGVPTYGVGFGMGIDRIMILMEEYNLYKIDYDIDLYFIVLDNNIYAKVIDTVNNLSDLKYIVDMNISNRSLNANLKFADKLNSKYVCIIGEDEVLNNTCVIKNMKNNTQKSVEFNLNNIIESIKE